MYQALYRKYRPKKFSEAVGQQVIVKTLINALTKNRTSHAYMFSGPRGTGKTTFAKIFAKNINCLNPINGEACEKCENCLHINSGSAVDIIEIDAASNNGVDEIREIRDKINIVPTYLRYKVYIIDEVHMLTIGAFNALLKTLEEPPEHAVFILATTDPQKVPITITSRCQLFAFEKLSIVNLMDKMREVCNLEKIGIDEKSLEAIAIYSDGGMRDALGLLDKLISYTNDTITIDDVRKISGLISFEEISKFITNLLAHDVGNIVDSINEMNNNGIDLINFVNEVIKEISNKLETEVKANTAITDDYYELIIKLNDILNLMKNSSTPKIIFETSLIKYLLENSKIISREIISVENNDVKQERSVDKKIIEEKSIPITTNSVENELKKEEIKTKPQNKQMFVLNYEEIKTARVNNTFARASKHQLLEIKDKWLKLNDYTLDRNYGSAVCLLVDGTLRAASDENIIISFKYDSLVERGKTMFDRINLALENILNLKHNIVLLTDEEWEKEKETFIKNKNNHIEYQYIKEPEPKEITEEENRKISNDISDTAMDAIELFGDNIVEIK